MNPFSGLPGKEKAVELLRWIGVLPAAVLGSYAAQSIGVLVRSLAVQGGGRPAQSGFFSSLLVLTVYVANRAAFVIAGAKMAPRGRIATTIVLAVSSILISLVVHIIKQTNPGVVNYTHFTAESTGVTLGVAYLFYSRQRRDGSE